jgi:hypothetical protein
MNQRISNTGRARMKRRGLPSSALRPPHERCGNRLNTLAITAAAVLAVSAGWGQPSKASSSDSASARSPVYLSAARLPSPAKECLTALGARLQAPGQERVTLSGTYTDASGTASAQYVWEAPGNARFDRGNRPGQPLIYKASTGIVGPTARQADSDYLESLLDDATEAFLYGFSGGPTNRYLGGRYRADDGKTASYSGPYYDVYQTVGPARAQATATSRTKAYWFESGTNLLAKIAYSVGAVRVVTQISGWTTRGGQPFPGKIDRIENGVTVGSFVISSVAVGPSAADSMFSGGQ